ncbi:hypothetical protein TNCT_339251, partial [Trichonephila clavata]
MARLENKRLDKIYKQRSRTYSTVLGKKWSEEYLLQLRSFHQVRNKDSTIKIRFTDIVLLQEDVGRRH